jgi:hypothetical protein
VLPDDVREAPSVRTVSVIDGETAPEAGMIVH